MWINNNGQVTQTGNSQIHIWVWLESRRSTRGTRSFGDTQLWWRLISHRVSADRAHTAAGLWGKEWKHWRARLSGWPPKGRKRWPCGLQSNFVYWLLNPFLDLDHLGRRSLGSFMVKCKECVAKETVIGNSTFPFSKSFGHFKWG